MHFCQLFRRSHIKKENVLLLLLVNFSSVLSIKKNVVLIVIDDLGQQDLGIYKNKGATSYYRTPNIDKLAQKSVVFKNAYATSPRCIPSRVSLLTGKYPVRFDVPNDKKFKYNTPHFTFGPEEVTTGEAFKKNGYKTIYIGKWHVTTPTSKENEGTWPWDQGFQSCHGISPGNPGTHWSPYGTRANPMMKIKPGPRGTYLTDELTNLAKKEIWRNRNKPFFLVLSHYAVHEPIHAPRKLIKTYSKLPKFKREYFVDPAKKQICKKNQNNPKYAAMLTSVDRSVGSIMATLEKYGLSKKTVVIFTSDNGGQATTLLTKKMNLNKTGWNQPTSNLPLRLGKRYLYEGGIRVPLLVHVPGVSAKISTCPVTGADLYPTMLDLTGLKMNAMQHKDGKSIRCTLKRIITSECRQLWKRSLIWYNGADGGTFGRHSAIRRGKYKLIKNLDTGKTELYNLNQDIGEKKDLSHRYKPLTKQLRLELDRKIKLIQGSS